jgi:hypothetical protein
VRESLGRELAALQAEMAEALLSGVDGATADRIAPGPITAEEALAVHRNTALHGVVHALRLAHPTVDALIGEEFFGVAARDFVRAHPPTSAWLTGYGEGFAGFLETYAPLGELPYLADVARFDFAVEQIGGQAAGLDGAMLDLGAAVLTLDASLRLIALHYPAAAIRDAIADDERLAELDVGAHRQVLALWRLADGAGLRLLSPAAAAFLAAMLAGEDPAEGLAEADLDALKTDVFAAPFAHLSLKTETRP